MNSVDLSSCGDEPNRKQQKLDIISDNKFQPKDENLNFGKSINKMMQLIPILPEEITSPTVAVAEFFALKLPDRKLTSKILSILTHKLPLPSEFDHLKRVNKSGEILLAPVVVENADFDEEKIVADMGLAGEHNILRVRTNLVKFFELDQNNTVNCCYTGLVGTKI